MRLDFAWELKNDGHLLELVAIYEENYRMSRLYADTLGRRRKNAS
jgi:hypothetical protein